MPEIKSGPPYQMRRDGKIQRFNEAVVAGATVDLANADLRNVELQGADLRDAYLRGADLRG